MDEIERHGGVVRAIEDGWIQMRLAEWDWNATEDRLGDAVVVGQNHFRREGEESWGRVQVD
jgi:methylmalonyl-CoA mutase N-terminal domain/subunit